MAEQRPPPVLPPGAEFDGLLVLPTPARIDGHVRGEILAASDVWVGPDGFVEADLEGATIVIEGRVAGDVKARARIDLRSTGRVRGRLSAPRLCIAEGSIVDGPCRAGPASHVAPDEAADAAPERAAPGRGGASAVTQDAARAAAAVLERRLTGAGDGSGSA